MTALCFIGTQGMVYPMMEGHIQKEHTSQPHHCEDLKTLVKLLMLWRPEI